MTPLQRSCGNKSAPPRCLSCETCSASASPLLACDRMGMDACHRCALVYVHANRVFFQAFNLDTFSGVHLIAGRGGMSGCSFARCLNLVALLRA